MYVCIYIYIHMHIYILYMCIYVHIRMFNVQFSISCRTVLPLCRSWVTLLTDGTLIPFMRSRSWAETSSAVRWTFPLGKL